MAAQVFDIEPTEVVTEADNIEALAVAAPTLVLERLNAGEIPREIVIDLIAKAMSVTEGKIPDLVGLQTLMPDRITLLDPTRPAHDLLEDLLDGIRGCRAYL